MCAPENSMSIHLVLFKEVEPIHPVLHHVPALFHVIGVVVGRAHLIRVDVRELRFDPGSRITDLLERRRERAANPVRGQPASVSEVMQAHVDRVVADAPPRVVPMRQ
jgi:hypothetical protein